MRLRQLDLRWRDETTEIWEAPPRHLFHYTSGSALHGILSQHALRGGHFGLMNDRSEFEYGQELFRETARDVIDETDDNSIRDWLIDCTDPGHLTAYDLYFTSFCEKDDLLSQWRGYGGGDTRYCIRLDSAKLKPHDSSVSEPREVIYSPSIQRRTLYKLLTLYVGLLREWPGISSRDLARATQQLISATIGILVFFKHPAFAEEREWRCIRLCTRERSLDDVSFIASAGLMKPLRVMLSGNIFDPKLPISQVTVGVHPSGAHAARSARMMLDKYGYQQVSVVPSRVPLLV